MDPFFDSQSLAEWAAKILAQRDIDSLVKWRMLEQWMQSEIFRAVEIDDTISWNHLGEGEQPYWSNLPKKPSKPDSVPRIDLVFAQPTFEAPKQIIWFELKHIGRNQKTLRNNSINLDPDLVALYAIDPVKTKEVWLNPPAQVVNESKTELWRKYGSEIDKAEHLYAQVVLVRKELVDAAGNEIMIKHSWLKSFEKRANVSAETHGISIHRADTANFTVFALVGKLNNEEVKINQSNLGIDLSTSPIPALNKTKNANSILTKVSLKTAADGDSQTTCGFIKLRGLGVDRNGESPGTPVKISWRADDHIIELHYKYKSGWDFEGFILDGEAIDMPKRFSSRDLARDFYLNEAYRMVYPHPLSPVPEEATHQ